MRATKRKRPQRRTKAQPPLGIDLFDIASKITYVGSVEHKSTPSFAGQPRPRADASLCDAGFHNQQREITERLKDSVREGNVGAPWENDFPRYVWGTIDGQCYEARLVNKEAGQYKGYPLKNDEWPKGIVTDNG